MSELQTQHFDALYTVLPSTLKAEIDDLLSRATRESAVKHTLDQLVRFCLGRDTIDEDLESRKEWDIQRHKSREVFSRFYLDGEYKGKKRALEEDESGHAELATGSKKVKVDARSDENFDEDPLFTLHSVSVSSPIRKKVNITIHHKDTLSFAHPTSGAHEASLPLSSLTRAFLIRTPGRSKPHWTVVLLTKNEQNQIIFGLDAIPSSITTTTYPDPPRDYPKGTESDFILKQFLSYLPSLKYQEPSTNQFGSAVGEPHLDAYLRAKDGHLFFFEDGLLFGEKKPCIWIPINRIEDVRTLSATGRTFSIFVTQIADASCDEEEAEDGEEIEFSLIDGKNLDAVALWVTNNRAHFGIEKKSQQVDRSIINEKDEPAGSKEQQLKEKAGEDSDSSDDCDYETDSESDGGSTSQSSDEAEEDHSEVEEEQLDGDDEALLSANHPLLRPGAMPRMSRAAIDAVVSMVEGDLTDAARGRGEAEDELDD